MPRRAIGVGPLSARPTSYIVDGTALLFRGYYAMRAIEAPDGTPVNGVFGMGMALQRLLNENGVEHVAVAFDCGPRTFRNDMFPDYKANRGAPPEDLVPQFDLARGLAGAMGLACCEMPDFEADDVMATLAARCREAGHDVVLVASDKDLAQLLRPGVTLMDPAKGTHIGADQVPDRLGVRAEQVCDLFGLMGDSSDNIPGVRGVGKVAACGVLAEFDHLEQLYADLGRVESLPIRGAKSLRKKLEEQREQAFLSRELTVLREDVPLGAEAAPGALAWGGDPGEELDAFAEQWGLGRVAAALRRWA